MHDRLTNIGVYLAALIALIDQGTKWWVLRFIMTPPRRVEVTSFFNVVLSMNEGITFGWFSNEQTWLPYVLTFVAIAIILFLLNWLMTTTSTMVAFGLGLVMGGAIGNVIDRLTRGAVVDFLDFHLGDYHWYAFNLADTAIVIGVGLLLLENFLRTVEK